MSKREALHKFYRSFKYRNVTKHYEKVYKNMQKGLGEPTEEGAEYEKGKKAWIEKWSGFPVKPDPMYFKLYSMFVGPDSRIVPENICRVNIEPCLNQERFRSFYADKNTWDMLFPSGIFPPTVFRCMDGIMYTKDYQRMTSFDNKKLYEILNQYGARKFAVKPTRDSNSSHGFDTINLLDGKYYWGDKKTVVTANSLTDHVGNNFIVQPFMTQHPELSKFCKSSVNPIRIITYKSVKDDSIYVLRGGVLRIGFEGEENDGTHGNGKFVGINDDGTLKHEAVDYLGKKVTVFNDIDFTQEHKLPNFDKVKEAAINVAKKVLHHRLLAFDIMIDEKGNPVVFEFNIDDFSMWLAQFTGEVAWGDFTDEIIEYSRENINKVKMMYLY